MIGHLSPRAVYRLVGARGQQRVVTVLTRCGLPRPVYCLADAPHTHGLPHTAYRPTMVSGRVLWPLGDPEEARAAALTPAYGAFPRAAVEREPSSRVPGVLTEGFDRPTKRRRPLFPRARLGHGRRHALTTLPKHLVALASPVRQALRMPFHTLWYRACQRQGGRVLAMGHR